MDAGDIFKKLSVGVTFPKKRKENQPIKSESNELNGENINASKKITSNEKFEIERINNIRNKNNIKISGENVPPPLTCFDDLAAFYNVSSVIVENIKNCGYTCPTPIQMQAIPAMLLGKQILACAPTGSGKTAAFLIPIVHSLGRPRNVGFRAVIVSPTRELSRQTYRECERICEGTDLRIYITTKMKDTIKKSSNQNIKKYDILITTPNRLVYLLNQEPSVLSLKNVEWLIIDESDKLFETGIRGFRDQLAVIYQSCDAKNIKRAMFSATYTTEVAKWSRKNLEDLVLITIGHRNTTVESVEQELIYVGNEEGKLIAMRDLIRKGISPPVLIFLQSKERARELFQELLYDGINVEVIHADRTQVQRDNVVKAFREGKIWVLICTELMGRGIDFKGVNLVINYDFPPSAISYIHRIGRTGRAGRKGKAVTFFTDNDTPYLKSVVNVMKESNCEVPEFLLSLKKPHKNIRRKLELKAPTREDVTKKPHRYKALMEKKKHEILNKCNNNDKQEMNENLEAKKKTEKRKRKKSNVQTENIKKIKS